MPWSTAAMRGPPSPDMPAGTGREREVITDGTVGVCLASGAEGTKVTHVLAGFIWEHSNKNLSSRVWTCVFVSKILMEALFARDTG